MKTRTVVGKLAAALAIASSVALSASASLVYTAFDSSTAGSSGWTTWDSSLGEAQVFTVGASKDIYVQSLGATSDYLLGNGSFSRNITVAIYAWNSAGGNLATKISGSALASKTFSPSISGSSPEFAPSDSSVFNFLGLGNSLKLNAGSSYVLVTTGYTKTGSPQEKYSVNGNVVVDDGGGLIAVDLSGNLGPSYEITSGGVGTWVGTAKNSWRDGTTVAAGTFTFSEFSAVPEASTFAVAGVGMLGLVYMGRGLMRRRSA